MSFFPERNVFSEVLCKWMTSRWLLTPAADRFFLFASLINLLFAVAVALVFWGSVSWRPTLLGYWQVQVILGVLGALTAITGIMLMHGTKKYWRELDDSPASRKNFWRWTLDIGVNYGACFYYFLVYRPKARHFRLNSN